MKTLIGVSFKNLSFFYLYIGNYNLLRVISKGEVRKGREAGTIHRWFAAVVLLG